MFKLFPIRISFCLTDYVKLAIFYGVLRDRLMVGRLVLAQVVGVRVLLPQRKKV